MTRLERDYFQWKAIDADFDYAYENKDEVRMNFDRDQMATFKQMMKDVGNGYENVIWLYIDSRKRGNQVIDLDDINFVSKVEPVLNAFVAWDVKEFTFSSTWSGAVEVAWEFLKYGYRLEGMCEVEKRGDSAPAFRFVKG